MTQAGPCPKRQTPRSLKEDPRVATQTKARYEGPFDDHTSQQSKAGSAAQEYHEPPRDGN